MTHSVRAMVNSLGEVIFFSFTATIESQPASQPFIADFVCFSCTYPKPTVVSFVLSKALYYTKAGRYLLPTFSLYKENSKDKWKIARSLFPIRLQRLLKLSSNVISYVFRTVYEAYEESYGGLLLIEVLPNKRTESKRVVAVRISSSLSKEPTFKLEEGQPNLKETFFYPTATGPIVGASPVTMLTALLEKTEKPQRILVCS